MILKIYKTNKNHRRLRELIEDPEVFCINKSMTEIIRIPYKNLYYPVNTNKVFTCKDKK